MRVGASGGAGPPKQKRGPTGGRALTKTSTNHWCQNPEPVPVATAKQWLCRLAELGGHLRLLHSGALGLVLLLQLES
jgi:hypothetical protein